MYHLHSDLSNGVTNVDSVTKFDQYIERAKECGMRALGFSEHGSVFEWYHKKCAIEDAGMKYIHGVECYLTETLESKVRDNYHCVLIAANYDGFLELNRLVSNSFNRNDNHFYYVPRISFDELFHTSNNILVTTACVGGVLGKGAESILLEDFISGETINTEEKFIEFLSNNKDRVFLEIGHHMDDKQKEYNKKMVDLSESLGIKLIAGTDTHALNETHASGRSILQKSKGIHFDGEDQWDLTWKTYEELCDAYKSQGVLQEDTYLMAIENTNVLADMVESYEIDTSAKYPHIYDNAEEVFKKKIEDAIDNHPYALQNHTREELEAVVAEELDVYKATNSIDFMLLQTYIREWEKENGIQCGYGRGSVSGSMIAYLLGITQMDSLKFNLNFFRFQNPERVSLSDIDTDYSGHDRDRVKEFLLKEKMGLSNINSAEIITFNTIALKGAIRDVCRAVLRKDENDKSYLAVADYISKNVDDKEDELRKEFPDIFEYADIVNGTIVSIGTHPSGVLVGDFNIDELVGTCSTSTSDYPISMLNMKELDSLMMVKLDILGLDNIGVINETCKMLGIERLTPDNTDLEDMDVWRSIRDDTTLIFQWESNSARQFLKRFMSDTTLKIAHEKIPNFSMVKWLSFGNGLIRPACASFRDSVAKGEFYDNGFEELNEFLAPEAGRIAMQETIMEFLVKFCGYSRAESDTVRRGIAKKKGTEQLIPEIRRRFIEYSSSNFDISEEKCEEVIDPFIQVILDASAYAFSWNHSDSYSCIGYICGYLRYYYPYEFLTAALNIFSDNIDKTAEITKYAAKQKINITSPKFGASRSGYFYNKDDSTIAKGLASMKYMGAAVADELYELSTRKTYDSFVELLCDIDKETTLDSRQLSNLIKIDYFSMFGNQRELLRIVDFVEKFKFGDAKKIRCDEVNGTQIEHIVRNFSTCQNKNGTPSKFYTLLDVMAVLREIEMMIKDIHMDDLGDIVKVKNFEEIMGFAGYVSGNSSDRRKLYIKEVFPLKNRTTGEQFGYSIITKSIGSGKEARFTVRNSVFKKSPIKKGDVIYCEDYYKNGIYFTMTKFHKILA